MWDQIVCFINHFYNSTKQDEQLRAIDPQSSQHQGIDFIVWNCSLCCAISVPFMYCWSPTLMPKPLDWGSHIDVVGFFFLNQSRVFDYQAPQDLLEFLEAGEPPVYIGFGSMVVRDPKKLTQIIFNAVTKAGVRVLLSKGWSSLGEDFEVPRNMMLLDNCPHDWLFQR